MRKSELLASVAADAGTSKVLTERVLSAYYRAVVRALRRDNKLSIPGFGTYSAVATKNQVADEAGDDDNGFLVLTGEVCFLLEPVLLKMLKDNDLS